jgi:hypothetical protein
VTDHCFVLSCAPLLTPFCRHPFTISSAPQEHSVTVHIRVLGEGSWTRGLLQYCSVLGPAGASYIKLDRAGPSGKLPGKITGPDGRAILHLDGPHSAPTQHIGEYSSVLIIGSGIGATPLSSTLKSIVFHKWRVNVGECYPDRACFAWVCAHRDIDAFRWLIRTIREAQDEVDHMRRHNASAMANKSFAFHIYLTSAPHAAGAPTAMKALDIPASNEIGFWGPPRVNTNIDKSSSSWVESDLYAAMSSPTKGSVVRLGDLVVHEGRPGWSDLFQGLSSANTNTEVGVTYCGHPAIAKDLARMCYTTNKSRQPGAYFQLHKENF